LASAAVASELSLCFHRSVLQPFFNPGPAKLCVGFASVCTPTTVYHNIQSISPAYGANHISLSPRILVSIGLHSIENCSVKIITTGIPVSDNKTSKNMLIWLFVAGAERKARTVKARAKQRVFVSENKTS